MESTGDTRVDRLSRKTALLLAIVCGAAVANVYYAQPLIPVLADALGITTTVAVFVVTAAQIGYAASLLLVVPLGDVVERRALVTVLLGLSALSLFGTAAAPSIGPLLAGITLVGVTSAVAQIVVPLSASLAADGERGSVVGLVMGGLVVGIMVARVVAGLLAETGNWRLVFVIAGIAMALLAVLVRFLLPVVPPTDRTPYPRLLISILVLVRGEPLLRRRMALAGLGMASFILLWTASSLLLANAPYRFGPGTIGLFGLAGLGGGLAAMLAGRLVDSGRGRQIVTGGLALFVVSWLVLAAAGLGGRWGLVALVVGIVGLTFAQQATLIAHQSATFERAPHARSRVTTALMASAFLGGALASALTAVMYPLVGWWGICGLGVATSLAGLGVWAFELRGTR